MTVAERQHLFPSLALETEALERLGLEQRLNGRVGRRDLAVETVATAVLEDVAGRQNAGNDDGADGEAQADGVAALVCEGQPIQCGSQTCRKVRRRRGLPRQSSRAMS